ncbi:MAG: hypothetical protein P4L85_08275 [Paludisphaera borealis]|uniref:hypothetical protein n=1 Tax=Paludisphaera borealis TaxID=1387353 RepID=UPI0028498304|nr:hypothetical protein [Paludisphaera borealis]MDR3619332.1 hypothetical protein [Paludisphaera borealis]
MSENFELTVWHPSDLVEIPSNVSSPEEVVRYATPSLSLRDQRSIVAGFAAEGYEMVATFVWTKAAATLKKQLATLGMEFVGEMLGRSDFLDDSDPATSISDIEAISLAEDLGMVTTTQAMRLKHSLELVTHFANLETGESPDEAMEKEEAVNLLKSCVRSILGKPKFEVAIHFAKFRKSLAERVFSSSDSEIETIINSPYFFIRTTVSVLLSLVKAEKGAPLEHAVGNTILVIPKLWEGLKPPEKWQVGQSYAEVSAAGNRPATAGLKKALTLVHGFDYVPESLRSNTFIEASTKVLIAHFGLNNFHNEESPMSNLANLGTAIPKPAFGRCMEATLAVWLGNHYGISWAAQPHAEKLLNLLRTEQWEYYVNECLYRDRTVLDKLASTTESVKRWRLLVEKYSLNSIPCSNKRVKFLMSNSGGESFNPTAITRWSSELRLNVTK